MIALVAACGGWTVVSARADPPPHKTKACSDGVDNDGDQLVDLADPGCGSPHDNDEHDGDPAVAPAATVTPAATASPMPQVTATAAPPVTAAPDPPPLAAAPAPGPPSVVKTAPQTPEPVLIVRMAGVLRPRGALVRLLRITAPPGASVSVRCRGRHCPVARLHAVVAGTSLRVRRLERLLVAGTRLEIRVLVPGHTGKFTAFRIRRDRVPARRDACLPAGSTRPVPC